MIKGSDDCALARHIIEVHGAEAAGIARENARGAALAGQATQAKSWIKVLGIIQRQLEGDRSSMPTTRNTSPVTRRSTTALG